MLHLTKGFKVDVGGDTIRHAQVLTSVTSNTTPSEGINDLPVCRTQTTNKNLYQFKGLCTLSLLVVGFIEYLDIIEPYPVFVLLKRTEFSLEVTEHHVSFVARDRVG